MTTESLNLNLARIERKLAAASPADKETIHRLETHKAQVLQDLARLKAPPQPKS